MNNNFKRIASLALSVLILCVTAAGCTEDNKKATKKKAPKKTAISSVDDNSKAEDTESYDDQNDYADDDSYYYDDMDYADYETEAREKRPLAQVKENKEYLEKFIPEFKSENVEWDGPDGYTIIYPQNDSNALISAKKLKDFFEKSDKVTIKIASDDIAKGKKEILVGNTNRYKTSLSEQKFAVTLKDGNLIFEGGHYIMVRKAVDWFTTIKRVKGKVAILTGEAKDFVSKLANGYVYVWGDEFDGNGFPDASRWDERMFMGYSDNFKALDHSTDVTRVEDGRLKMTAVRYYDPNDEKVQYANGTPLTTSTAMSFMYGYAEIRARVPFVKGAWPAWWTRSATSATPGEGTALNQYAKSCIYDVEVDIFEVFSSENTLYPNLHKWYRNTFKNGKVLDKAGLDITDTILGKPLDGLFNSQINVVQKPVGYTFEKTENLKNEYHTYGYLWTPEKMDFSVDGKVYRTFDLTVPFDNYSNDDLNQFYYFLFDCHLYTTGNNKIRNESLPVDFYVDYIRLYQLPGEGQINNAAIK